MRLVIPQVDSSHSWASLKPGAKSIFQISHMGTGTQALGPCPAAYPGVLAGSWVRRGAGRKQASSLWDASVAGRGFTRDAIVLVSTLMQHCKTECQYTPFSTFK